MYEELDRIKTSKRRKNRPLTEIQKRKLLDVDNAEEHFIDLLNVYPLFEGYIEGYKKILREAGWEEKDIIKVFNRASKKTNWVKNRNISNRMEIFLPKPKILPMSYNR